MIKVFEPFKAKDKLTGKLCSCVKVKDDNCPVEYFTNPFHISELVSLSVESISGIWPENNFNDRFIKL